jgi:Flp pilus assembly protein TadG
LQFKNDANRNLHCPATGVQRPACLPEPTALRHGCSAIGNNPRICPALFPARRICPAVSLITPQICHSILALMILGELYSTPGLPRECCLREKVMSNAAKTVARKSLKRFIRKEDGNIATFSVCLFALMVMCGGLAVDLMRYEHTRTALQQTLDRCTLAAAQLKLTLDRKAVCQDYVTKAGLTIPASSIQVTGGAATDSFATVQVSSQLEMPTIFAGMLGIPKFDVPARSVATQAVTNVEIAMVLDVSRSMILDSSGNVNNVKLNALKVAAKEFVSTVLANDTENRTSIAIVPYNGQVNLGATLAAKYNVSPQHNIVANVNCVDLPPSVYSTNTISRTLALPQTMYVDSYSSTENDQYGNFLARNIWRSAFDGTSGATSHAMPNVLNRWCPAQPTNIIRLPTNQIATIPAAGSTPAKPGLHANIDGLVGIGATSINAGMKWGMAMLDPANRSMFTDLRTAGEIPSHFVNRPYDYATGSTGTPDAMKIIVLMTDGENFPESRVNDAFRSGNSPIYRSSNGVWSIRHQTGRPAIAGTDQYFVPSLCSASSTTPTANVPTSCDAWQASPAGTAPHTQLTWPQVFENQRLSYVAWQFYGRALGTDDASRRTTYANMLAAMRTQTSATDMNTQLQAVCNDARTRKVVVYGIAFEAPAGGKTQIQNCSTSATHYYEASSLNVSTAFKSIAARISQLRLTQ